MSEGLERLAQVLAELRARRVLLLTGPSRRFVEELAPALAGLEHQVFSGARRHVPEAVVSEAGRALAAFGADTVLALGGGSAIGLGKALRLEHAVKFVAVPTTYAGSESTTLYGITGPGGKRTGRDPRVKPDAVIDEPAFSALMPKTLTVTSLLNALAHPVSAFSTGSLHGDARETAFAALEAVYEALEALLRSPESLAARRRALEGARLAAGAIEHGKPGLHHALAHALGGRFDLEHGALHGLLLPHSLHRLRRDEPALVESIEARLGARDLEAELFDFLTRAEAPTSLKGMGVVLAELERALDEHPALDREIARFAYHGRRPSRSTRYEELGAGELVSFAGTELGAARRVVVALHGRGSNADAVLRRVREIAGDEPGLCLVAPQARDNAWYETRHYLPRAEIGPALAQATAAAARVLEHVFDTVPPERVVLFGFSQGACLAVELACRQEQRLAGLVALSGAVIGERGEEPAPGAGLRGLPVLLGSSVGDPWLPPGDLERTALHLRNAGADVTLSLVAGDAHGLHAIHRILARDVICGRPGRGELRGLGNAHETEAVPGALPLGQNSPRHSPYGLYAEQLSGTGFVAPRARNLRTWTYRIRPSADQGLLEPLEHVAFVDDLAAGAVEPNLVGFEPLEVPSEPVDWLDGLRALGGCGTPASLRGYAVYLYAANRGMDERSFVDADGDLLILPVEGTLTLQTELGVLEARPGEVALVPRGVPFSVLFEGSRARGYAAEVYGRHFSLPERGPVGANGLADPRHFRAPTAFYENRLAPGYRRATKLGGRLYEARDDHSPHSVVAWHGNYAPFVYDLTSFSPSGNTRFDHGDPSIYTVLSAPLDEPGSHALDLIAFVPRWDPSEGTFRPPYFHKNAVSELNGVLFDPSPHAAVRPGGAFLTPSMTPHGPAARSVAHALAGDDASADRPAPPNRSALWFQLESALPFSLSRWARTAKNRLSNWHERWGNHKARFEPPA